ncbi:hypothetical protein [Roseobacter sp. HKCCA0434]|uniref:hypothetical protein n=1 Tax=Roseobacter sp. HKCCA0434 TaxID=3079297 RepID=UPI00290594C0|nr:hypothetical protein [Roseobacter sp. HKCCA0434]
MSLHRTLPLVMGTVMGLMLPWMIHSGGGAGIRFVLAHVVAILAIASLALIRPGIRRALRRHVTGGHLPRMGAGLALGLAATCAICLAIGEHPWT